MSFGIQVPDWKIRGDLSYARCEELTSKGDFNIAERPKGRSEYWLTDRWARHPLTHKEERAYSFRMYRTHVLTWFKDGTVAYDNWDSAGTREVQQRWGPIAHIWKDSRSKFAEKARFTTPNGSYVDGSFPFNDPVVDCNGYVHGLVDTYKVIDPARRKERMALAKQMRQAALPRILLREFGDLFSCYGNYRAPKAFGRRSWGTTNGWYARVPYDSIETIEAFARGQTYEEVVQHIGNRTARACLPAKDEADAARKCVDTMIRDYLSGSQWYVEKKVEYEPVKVTA